MAQHKWHKEIKAWADGAEIELRFNSVATIGEWESVLSENPRWDDPRYEYRIKPQPKEPQYLYVYKHYGTLCYEESLIESPADNIKYIGKIKLENDDGDN